MKTREAKSVEGHGIYLFDTVEEMIRVAEETRNTILQLPSDHHASFASEYGRAHDVFPFTGFYADGGAPIGPFHNFAEIRLALRDSEPEEKDMLREARESLKDINLPRPRSIKRIRAWKEDGEELSSDRLHDGSDTPWRGFHKTVGARARPAAAVFQNVAILGSQSGKALRWTGAATVAICEALENAGFRVSVHAVAGSTKVFGAPNVASGTGTYEWICRVKSEGSPVVPPALFAMSRGYFLRTAGFMADHMRCLSPIGLAQKMSVQPGRGGIIQEVITEAGMDFAIDRKVAAPILIRPCFTKEACIDVVRSVLSAYADTETIV